MKVVPVQLLQKFEFPKRAFVALGMSSDGGLWSGTSTDSVEAAVEDMKEAAENGNGEIVDSALIRAFEIIEEG